MTTAFVRLVYRSLLRALPPEFRRRHGEEMSELFAEALEAAARRGALQWVYAAARGCADVIDQAARMRSKAQGGASTLRPAGIMESTIQDLRLAVRSLSKAPGFTVVAILTLAFGIGANTSIFSLVNAVLLRSPAHVEQAEELVSIFTSDFSGGEATGMNSYVDFLDFRDQPAIADAAATTPGVVNVASNEGLSEIFVSEFVTANYFELLGVRPPLGRGFTAEEADPTSGAAVAVLSHGLWMRRFGGDPSVVGQTLRASGKSLTIVGIAPEGFTGTLPLVSPELWMPVSTHALIQGESIFERRSNRGWFVTARLSEGATVELAQEQMTALAGRLQEEDPGAWTDVNDEVRRVGVHGNIGIPPQFKGAANAFAALMLVVVGIVLLIACANVANLTLARASRRGREVALKVVLGAGRGRIVRQLLAESAIVGLSGGIVGAAVTVALMGAAKSFRPVTGVAVTLDLGVDSTVFIFSGLVTGFTVLAVGLLPAFKASRPDLVPALKEGSGEGSGPFRWYELRNLLVISQVSASLVLLVGAGLFVKGLRAAVHIDPGFAVEGIATMTLDLGPEGYSPEEATELFETLEARLAAAPGVEATSVTDALPMTLSAGRRRGVSVPGYEPSQGEDMEFQFHSVGPDFVDVLGMELLRGREFTEADRLDGAAAVMVNETFAERFWPGENPLGKLVNWSGQEDAEVVGLLADAMYRDLRDIDRPAFFIPAAQNPSTTLTLVARTGSGGAEDVLASMRSELGAIDARLPITTLQTMEEAVAFTLLPQRVASGLLSLAGSIGLLLAMVGLYGVMSFLVAQRTREVGVRMALGAESRDVVRMVVGRGVGLSLAGAVIGLGLAAFVTRFAQSLLYGVSPLDVSVFVAMALIAVSVAAFASWMPARRASSIDPMEALRHD